MNNVFISSAQQPTQSNIGIDGVVVLLFNNEGVAEAGNLIINCGHNNIEVIQEQILQIFLITF